MTDLSFADLIAMREELKRLLSFEHLMLFEVKPNSNGLAAKLGEIEEEIKRRLV